MRSWGSKEPVKGVWEPRVPPGHLPLEVCSRDAKLERDPRADQLFIFLSWPGSALRSHRRK